VQALVAVVVAEARTQPDVFADNEVRFELSDVWEKQRVRMDLEEIVAQNCCCFWETGPVALENPRRRAPRQSHRCYRPCWAYAGVRFRVRDIEVCTVKNSIAVKSQVRRIYIMQSHYQLSRSTGSFD
jgi:hypothetical protein